MIDWLLTPPSFWLIAAALLLPWCAPRVRRGIMLGLPLWVLLLIWVAPAQGDIDLIGHSL